MPDAGPVPILVLVRDLIFSSRIMASARASKSAIKLIRDPAKLAGEIGRLLVVDLNQEGAIEAASDWMKASGMTVVGFVSHVDAVTVTKARNYGIKLVMARSRFVEVLDSFFKPEGAEGTHGPQA